MLFGSFGLGFDRVGLGFAMFPCAAFLLYSYDRKNWPAGIFAGAFTLCHLIHAIVNFVI